MTKDAAVRQAASRVLPQGFVKKCRLASLKASKGSLNAKIPTTKRGSVKKCMLLMSSDNSSKMQTSEQKRKCD